MAARQPASDHDALLDGDDWLPEVERLTVEEGRAYFDAKVQAALGISGTEFLRRFDGGAYDLIEEDEAGREIIRLIMSIQFARSSISGG